MLKGKLAACCLVAFGLLVASGTAFAGIVDPCNSTAAIVFGSQPGPIVTARACPRGDMASLALQGFHIAFHIEDGLGNGIPNVPASDIWVDDCDPVNDLIVLCGGSSSSGADQNTDALGNTIMSQIDIVASGCALGVICIVQGTILEDGTCNDELCLNVRVASVDMNSDGFVGFLDFVSFAGGYPTNPFSPCTDFDASGANTLADLVIFSEHFKPSDIHECI
jgi:hypothetical protein